jgi:hypothetical protein
LVVLLAVFPLATMATQHLMPTWLLWALALVASQGVGWMIQWANQRVAARRQTRTSGRSSDPGRLASTRRDAGRHTGATTQR